MIKTFISLLLILTLINPAFAVRPMNMVPKIERYEVKTETKSAADTLSIAVSQIKENSLPVVDLALVGAYTSRVVANKKPLQLGEMIDFLDRMADFYIAQMQPASQHTLRQAYYYDTGLDQLTDQRQLTYEGHLSFGMSVPAANKYGFKVNWPDYLHKTPLLQRVLKIEYIILSIGMKLEFFGPKNGYMENFISYEKNKQSLEFLILAASYIFQDQVLQFVPQTLLYNELESLVDEIPQNDIITMAEYIRNIRDPFNLLMNRMINYSKNISGSDNIDEGLTQAGAEVFLDALNEESYQKALESQYEKLLNSYQENLYNRVLIQTFDDSFIPKEHSLSLLKKQAKWHNDIALLKTIEKLEIEFKNTNFCLNVLIH